MAHWLREGLLHGGALCAFMTIVIVASLRQNPKIWAGDAPPAIRAQIGPLDERTKGQKSAWGIVTFAGLALIFGRLVVRVVEQHGDAYPFGLVFGAALICFEMFNLFDALIIDIGLTVFQPRWATIPGIDTSAMRNPRWHIRGFVMGAVMGVPFAGIVTGLGWVANLIVSRSAGLSSLYSST